MQSQHLETVAATLDVPVAALASWQEYAPEAFETGPDGYDVAAIAAAGAAYMDFLRAEPTELLRRLERETVIVRSQVSRILHRAAEVKAAMEIFQSRSAELFRAMDPAQEFVAACVGRDLSDEDRDLLRRTVEYSIATIRAAGLGAIECIMEGDAAPAPSRLQSAA